MAAVESPTGQAVVGTAAQRQSLNETLKQLKALGNEKVRAHNTKYGAGDNQFGVKHGDIRVLAKKIKTDHDARPCLFGRPGTSMPSSWQPS